jgi:hypothetical protein
VAREPYNRAGLFEEHFIWRFEVVGILDRVGDQPLGDAGSRPQ